MVDLQFPGSSPRSAGKSKGKRLKGDRGKSTESRRKRVKGERGKTTESRGKRFKGDRLPQWATDLVAAFLVALIASLKPYAELRCENAPNSDELPRTIRF